MCCISEGSRTIEKCNSKTIFLLRLFILTLHRESGSGWPDLKRTIAISEHANTNDQFERTAKQMGKML